MVDEITQGTNDIPDGALLIGINESFDTDNGLSIILVPKKDNYFIEVNDVQFNPNFQLKTFEVSGEENLNDIAQAVINAATGIYKALTGYEVPGEHAPGD